MRAHRVHDELKVAQWRGSFSCGLWYIQAHSPAHASIALTLTAWLGLSTPHREVVRRKAAYVADRFLDHLQAALAGGFHEMRGMVGAGVWAARGGCSHDGPRLVLAALAFFSAFSNSCTCCLRALSCLHVAVVMARTHVTLLTVPLCCCCAKHCRWWPARGSTWPG